MTAGSCFPQRQRLRLLTLTSASIILLVSPSLRGQEPAATAAASSSTKVRVLAPNTPLRIGPGAATQTVVVVAADTVLDVVGHQGEWYQVSLPAEKAPKATNPGTAFVLARLVEVVSSDGSRARLASLNENLQGLPTWPDEPSASRAEQVVQFDFAKLMYREGKQTKQIDCAVLYDDDTMTVSPYDLKKNEPDPTVAIKYADITSAEYTFGKSPRRDSAAASSAPALVSGGNSHWLVVTGKNGDSAVMTLDKGNYRRVITELESRAGIKVESNGSGK